MRQLRHNLQLLGDAPGRMALSSAYGCLGRAPVGWKAEGQADSTPGMCSDGGIKIQYKRGLNPTGGAARGDLGRQAAYLAAVPSAKTASDHQSSLTPVVLAGVVECALREFVCSACSATVANRVNIIAAMARVDRFGMNVMLITSSEGRPSGGLVASRRKGTLAGQ
jgi:hypothetical protein